VSRLLRDIVWKGQGRQAFVYAGFGFLLGLSFVLLSVQLYDRVYAGLRADLKAGSLARYLVVHKRIGNAQLMGRASAYFSEEEIDQLRAQPFVVDLGVFRSNSFTAALTMEQFQDMQVMLPLESLDDRFLDTIPPGWAWEPGDERIPVLLSSEFINLYNSVLAPSMNYPLFTRDFIQQYPLDIFLIGNRERRSMPIQVVGFSDRILSVLVPGTFLSWANEQYGGGERNRYSRLMLQVEDPGDPAIKAYLKKNNLETNQDALKSTAAGALQALLGILALLGLFFFVLAMVIFLMAFELTISRARREIDLLIQLGYTLPALVRAVMGSLLPVVLGLSALSILLLHLSYGLLRDSAPMQQFEAAAGIWWGVYAAAAASLILVLALSLWRIRSSLIKLADRGDGG
jgi:hypothetical protein